MAVCSLKAYGAYVLGGKMKTLSAVAYKSPNRRPRKQNLMKASV
jgi:hypothetical protein